MNLFQKLSNCKIFLYNKQDLSQKKVNKYLIALYVLLISSLFSFSGYTVGRVMKLGNLSHLEKELLVVDLQRDDFTEEKLAILLKKLKIQYPEIVLAQARLETGGYKSRIFRENHNLFGMKEAVRRINTAQGTQYNHAYYEHWRESVYDYAFYQCRYMGQVRSREEYFNLLSQSYAEDPMYVTKLKNEIQKRNLSKYF
jgi:uncharacterized FlgJ-related protein